MNRIERKEDVRDAANYFREEVLDYLPAISRGELCEMVDNYIYYQQSDITRDEAHSVIEKTCLQK